MKFVVSLEETITTRWLVEAPDCEKAEKVAKRCWFDGDNGSIDRDHIMYDCHATEIHKLEDFIATANACCEMTNVEAYNPEIDGEEL